MKRGKISERLEKAYKHSNYNMKDPALANTVQIEYFQNLYGVHYHEEKNVHAKNLIDFD